jgi:purine-binding chemotaxis protein CheW
MDPQDAARTLDSLWAEAQGEAGLTRFLTFKVHGQVYGIPVPAVLEIVRAQRIRRVPGTPRFVAGVINLRGKVVPVVDVRLRLELPEKAPDERTCIVITQCREQTVGLIVDDVRDVLGLPDSRIERHAQGGAEGRFISGFGIVDSQVRILLDLERLLFDDEHAGDSRGEVGPPQQGPRRGPDGAARHGR